METPRWRPAVLAGLVGILGNMAFLSAGSALGLRSESGGLLRLMLGTLGKLVPALAHHPPPTAAVWVGFHVGTGLVMVALYVSLFERRLRGPSWWRGFQFGLFPWCINAFLVLPLLGQGIAGHRVLSLGGMAWFFLANQVFAVITAVVYAERARKPAAD